MRIVIGWHFLYEGLTKLLYPGWTSSGYLKGSTGPLAGLFQWLGTSPALTGIIDFLNVWGLIAIGLALMLGIAVRPAAWSGIALLSLYYLAYPPFFSPFSLGVSEGAYLIVNKNLVELFALSGVIAYPASHYGLQRWWRASRSATSPQRREVLADLAGLPVLGAFLLAVLRKHGWNSFEEANLARRKGPDQFTASATVKNFQFTSRADLKGTVPVARIGNLNVSRMIMGGNLIGGWAHARDLIYVSKLVRAYHHREKIFQTLALAESCGLNSLITNPALCGVINDYWRNGGRIQFISDCGNKDLTGAIQKSIDQGAAACYIQGALADDLVKAGKFDVIAEGLELIRKNGLPAGIGAHNLHTVTASVEMGLRPDFWMKTLHNVRYWSARPGEKSCDNIWCEDPAAVVAYMKTLEEPWIAFKVLAAGAIQPRDGFRYAFESGADFICVGMYDFQIVEDVNLALEVLRGPLIRERMWKS
ncbi:MAG: DoxX family protein [Bryobacteraceae bacterium]|nr:DoxX family protein [Bryobacteraceae bacterium]